MEEKIFPLKMKMDKKESKMRSDRALRKGKLFIGGLCWQTSEENLREHFSCYGEIIDCVVMRNNVTKRSRGFGFVTFKDPDAVKLVLAKERHELDGRTIDPKICNPRTSKPDKEKKDRLKVFLGGLPLTCTQSDLKTIFSKYGKVIQAQIMFNHEKKKSRG